VIDYLGKVREFHRAFGLAESPLPALPDEELQDLRRTLMAEEYDEYEEAEYVENLSHVAKELADIVYIAMGTAVSYGIPMDLVFAAVHDSNMSKLVDGKPVYREDGKVMKGPNYEPADIDLLLSGYTESSEHVVWQALKSGLTLDEICDGLPEPFSSWALAMAQHLWAEQDMRIMHVSRQYQGILQSIGATEDEVDPVLWVRAVERAPEADRPLLYLLGANKPIASTVWNELEPK
jgi:predicted HAD superfamily Cof-like phosphohydrolase